MSVPHINIPNSTPHSNLLHSALSRFEDSFTELNELLGTLALMIDGDGSSPAHFAYMTKKLGSDGWDSTQGEPSEAQNTVTKAAWDELNSLLFKLNTNAQVTDVNSALRQVFNKFR